MDATHKFTRDDLDLFRRLVIKNLEAKGWSSVMPRAADIELIAAERTSFGLEAVALTVKIGLGIVIQVLERWWSAAERDLETLCSTAGLPLHAAPVRVRVRAPDKISRLLAPERLPAIACAARLPSL